MAVLGKDHAGPRGHAGLEAELGGDAEFTRSRRRGIADRIADVIGANAERGFDHRAAHLHLSPRRGLGHLGQHDVVDGVRADGDERIGRDLGELLPAHAELLAERRDVDPVTGRELAHHLAQLVLGFEAAQPAVELPEHVPLVSHRGAVEALLTAIHQEPQVRVAGDHRLEHQPPELADPIGEARRDIDGERHLMLLQDGIGPLQRVTVAVVDRHRDKTPPQVALHEPPVHLLQADEVDAGTPQPGDDIVEKARAHFEQPVGLEAIRPWRPHMVQRHDHPDAAHEWPHEMVRCAEIKGLQPPANDVFL